MTDQERIQNSLHIIIVAGFLSLGSIGPLFFILDDVNFGAGIPLFAIVCFLLPSGFQPFISGAHRFSFPAGSSWSLIVFYTWAIISLGLITYIILQTGGILGSPFVWVYEFAVVVALCLTVFNEVSITETRVKLIFKKYRCAVFTLLASVVSILTVWFNESLGNKNLPSWALDYNTYMIIYTLFISWILFFLTEGHWKKTHTPNEK